MNSDALHQIDALIHFHRSKYVPWRRCWRVSRSDGGGGGGGALLPGGHSQNTLYGVRCPMEPLSAAQGSSDSVSYDVLIIRMRTDMLAVIERWTIWEWLKYEENCTRSFYESRQQTRNNIYSYYKEPRNKWETSVLDDLLNQDVKLHQGGFVWVCLFVSSSTQKLLKGYRRDHQGTFLALCFFQHLYNERVVCE